MLPNNAAVRKRFKVVITYAKPAAENLLLKSGKGESKNGT
jgi:hypothetical protein